MKTQEVDFRQTTTAVLEDFDQRFIDMVIQLLEQRNNIEPSSDTRSKRNAVLNKGYGLLVLADEDDEQQPFTITTEFLVPSNELAASFMVMWRRWCEKRNLESHTGLLSLIRSFSDNMIEKATEGHERSISNFAIGLMGAVLDNYPEVIGSMRWSVDVGFAPCLVVAKENNIARCGVCYGGKYQDEVA